MEARLRRTEAEVSGEDVTGGTNQDGIRIRVACLSKYALASRSME